MYFKKRSLAVLAPLAALFASRLAHAAGPGVVLLPTVTTTASAPQEWHRPTDADPPALSRWAGGLDGVVSEAVQDLGLSLDVFARRDPDAKDLSDQGLVARAKDSWVISPRLVFIDERTVHLEFRAVAPGSKVVLSETEDAVVRDLEMDAVVMLRDLVRLGGGSKTPVAAAPVHPATEAPPAVVERARSSGRAVLAVNAAALGAYVGFSLQRASGSDDPRLTYPLLALGAGIGLGSSMIVADEWDVGIGDAWYLAAGAWWPGAAGLLLAKSYNVPEGDRYVYGLAGAGTGLVLATVSLNFGKMSEGGATMAHTGGAFGLLLGGLGDLSIRGTTDDTPIRGMGYGAAVGVLAGGTLATQFRDVSNATILFIDLGGSLGALVGAAAASPVLFVKSGSTETKNRIWLGSIALGTLAGGAVGWWTTRSNDATPRASTSSASMLPYAGIVGESQDAHGRTAPAYGAGVTGSFW